MSEGTAFPPFSNIYGAASYAVLTEFMSPQEIIDSSEESFLQFLADKSINVMNPNAFTSLKSILGIEPVWAAGMLAEICDITAFHSSDALVKYTGLTWLKVILATLPWKTIRYPKPEIHISAIT